MMADKKESNEPPTEIVELAENRMQARKDRNWAEADALRDQITAAGWAIEDTPNGYRLKPVR
jgi:cysteinyl-tRNA synthetase